MVDEPKFWGPCKLRIGVQTLDPPDPKPDSTVMNFKKARLQAMGWNSLLPGEHAARC